MTPRNLSPQQMFIRLALEHKPKHAFELSNGAFAAWKEKAKSQVLGTLGPAPATVPGNPELTAEWRDRGVLKRRYLVDVGPHISAAVQVNFPENLPAGKKSPALLCWHGHGTYGKDPVMGNGGSSEIAANIREHNYDYGLQMAQKGFITFALDWMGCGERNDRLKPHFLTTAGDRDWCNLYYLHATLLGTTTLAINLAHARAVTDFVSSLPEVDVDRLGVMGLSGGGTMTVWTALSDERFKAAEIICYSDLFPLFGVRDINYCGSQITPGLFGLVDVPDLQGLLAPLPLLVDIGSDDSCFQMPNALACFEKVKKIYQAAKVEDRLHLDIFPGTHAWGGNKSVEFFRKYLPAKA